MTSVCIELISVCVESTLDVYRNRLPFVSKQLCFETSINLSNQSLTALHIQFAMHLGIDTKWQRGDAKVRISFIHNWSVNQRNHSTS